MTPKQTPGKISVLACLSLSPRPHVSPDNPVPNPRPLQSKPLKVQITLSHLLSLRPPGYDKATLGINTPDGEVQQSN